MLVVEDHRRVGDVDVFVPRSSFPPLVKKEREVGRMNGHVAFITHKNSFLHLFIQSIDPSYSIFL
jgi:hypothetical protein